MFSRREKNAVFEAVAMMGKALGSPRRLELIDLLAQAPRTVEQLAQLSEQSVANTSQHLQSLYAAGLVSRTREGTRIRYRLSGPEVAELWLSLRTTAAERRAEVQRAAREYLGPDIETIDRDELTERLRRGDVILIDVRPRAEYDAGHIDGARSVPLGELDRLIDQLPAGREIVAYCRGPYCAFAHQAVLTLRASGRNARRLDDGPLEWERTARSY